jgi:hypothetical protein
LPTSSTDRELPFSSFQLFSIIFITILILHAPLLRLPFFWDEAGYYVPAAYDLAHFHSVIPKTTMDSGHPPLSAAYLALWLTLSGWKPAVARVAMLLMAAFGLTNVFLLAQRVASRGVAVASTVATAVYPVFFVQSSLTHADITAAAFALWGIRLGIERRLWASQGAFILAVMSKEIAVITPVAVAIWEFFFSPAAESWTKRARLSAIRFVPVLPYAAWLLYHHHVTGRFIGGDAFYHYNVTTVVGPVRFLLALGLRLWYVLGFMNMLVLTAATAVAMSFPAVKDDGHERERIAIPIQLQFLFILLGNVIAFSLVGGALLTRYLLAVYPLVIIIGMSTLRRRIARWEWPAAMVVICFVLALFFDPPYRLAPEDNLTYKDFVELHVRAAHFLLEHEQGKTILAAWPATDELTRTYAGYVSRPLPVVEVENFSVEEVFKARAMRSQYQVAYVFSTKYDQPTWLDFKFRDTITQRYFDYHKDLQPEVIANILGGKIVFLGRKKAEWVAVIEMEQPGIRAGVER